MRFIYRELEKYFTEPLPTVEKLAELLTLQAWEVEEIIPKGKNDWELEIKILPDRAAEIKTPLDLAREISALFPNLKTQESWSLPDETIAREKIVFTIEQINNLLGIKLTQEQVIDFLKRVRVQVVTKMKNDQTQLLALIPAERQDLNIKEDLVDEVVRLYGYDKISSSTLTADLVVKHNPDFILANQARAMFTDRGYTEIYGYTFVDHGEVRVEKPLASDKAYLRDNLSEGMKKAIEFNLNRILFDHEEVKLFEIGTVFTADREEVRLVTGLGRKKPKKVIEILEKKLTDFDFKNIANNLDPFINRIINYRPVSVYPRIVRDVAVWVPENIETETVVDIIKKSAGELCVEGPILFDEFSKAGRKSQAFRLVFQSNSKTLSDDEANAQMDLIIKALESQTDFEVR